MQFNKFFISSALLTVLSVIQVEAHHKYYYEYKSKARPAEGWMGGIGDHAYACLKKRKKGKHGLRTKKNYGCFTQGSWGSTGGHTVGRYIVKKTKKTHKGKHGAICTSYKDECDLSRWTRYGSWGVCHQATNRFLYGSGLWYAHLGSGKHVSGYKYDRGHPLSFNSYVRYGRFGWGWKNCRKSCY